VWPATTSAAGHGRIARRVSSFLVLVILLVLASEPDHEHEKEERGSITKFRRWGPLSERA
jgi:hypothetical protein